MGCLPLIFPMTYVVSAMHKVLCIIPLLSKLKIFIPPNIIYSFLFPMPPKSRNSRKRNDVLLFKNLRPHLNVLDRDGNQSRVSIAMLPLLVETLIPNQSESVAKILLPQFWVRVGGKFFYPQSMVLRDPDMSWCGVWLTTTSGQDQFYRLNIDYTLTKNDFLDAGFVRVFCDKSGIYVLKFPDVYIYIHVSKLKTFIPPNIIYTSASAVGPLFLLASCLPPCLSRCRLPMSPAFGSPPALEQFTSVDRL